LIFTGVEPWFVMDTLFVAFAPRLTSPNSTDVGVTTTGDVFEFGEEKAFASEPQPDIPTRSARPAVRVASTTALLSKLQFFISALGSSAALRPSIFSNSKKRNLSMTTTYTRTICLFTSADAETPPILLRGI
jgi:hypothetical protein